jgi:hypothetical protein
MHPQLTLIAAQENIASLRRAADHDRLVHAAATPDRREAATPATFIRRLRYRLAQAPRAALTTIRPGGQHQS